MAQKLTGVEEIDIKLKEWLLWDKNEKTCAEIEELISKHDVSELRKRLCHRMEFGTAGLRAAMGAGNSLMNDLTIIQTTQGFVKYMLKTTPTVTERGVVIGYDARHNSHRFACLAASILINEGIPVYLYSQICPTPYVPYAVLKLKTDWGIMVTASHNPKEDNGYKVYFQNGSQIIPPHDSGIAQSIDNNLEPLASSWNTDLANSSDLRKDPFQMIHQSYMEDVKKLSYFREDNQETPLKFTYTAMHGVGYQFVVEALKSFNFKPCIPVIEQVDPDPEFPTVKYPNPEEGKSALDLAMKTADENNSTVILANDPDADRLAVAERQPEGWYVFKGNEIGAVLGWWLYSQYKLAHPDEGADVFCLASTVSSKILSAIAKAEGFNFEETLTGFKWMGNKTAELLKKSKTVLFAFEEAIGFMCGTNVLDKDGVSAAMVAAEMAVHLQKKGVTLKQQLENIYEKYGHHVTSNSYFICHDGDTIKSMFERLRNYDGPGKYPSSCGPYPIKYIRDLTTGYDNSKPGNKSTLPSSASSQMITFTFENGCVVTIRTSGTEPKIKYYSEFCADPSNGMDKKTCEAELQKMVGCVIENFYQPEKNKLIARST